jgi:PEGA domain
MGVRLRWAVACATLASLAGCEWNLPHGRAPTVSMRMQGSPPDATVTIDDHYVGPLAVVAARGVALPMGSHRISVEAEGYFPWDRIVEAKDKPVTLAVTLVAIPD